MNRNKVESGDIVTAPGYAGYLVVHDLDTVLNTGEPWWFCVGLYCDTCFDSYKESDLKIALKKDGWLDEK